MKELFFHQISLKTFKILIHRNALLDSLHELFQLGRNLYFVANDVLHCFQELCRMSRFKEHTGLAFFQSFDQGTVSASPVRVEQVVMFFPGFFYRFANLLVSLSRTRNLV